MSETADLTSWIGRTEQHSDWIKPSEVAAWHATLDRADPFPGQGDPVPPGFHWTLFPPLARQSELGEDGHARKGGFLPPVALPRRMWAGSRLSFHHPLLVGQFVRRTSVILRIDEKHGKSGRLVFVTIRHTLANEQGTAIEEEQDLVYRAPAQAAVAVRPAAQLPPQAAWQNQVVPDPVLLFRYSALTFNCHRIHYDRTYAAGVEGYPGLMVHGPLLATLLLDLLRSKLPEATLARFNFKTLRPTFDISPFGVCGEPADAAGHFRLWTTDNQGDRAMEAEAWMA